MVWSCPRCGAHSYHYNRSRTRNECDGCGYPLIDRRQEEQMMQYDRTISKANSHLLAGNWEQVISIIQPLMSQNPADKQLYRMALRAATKDYTDIDMNDVSMCTVANSAWEKLMRLNGIDTSMVSYSKAKREKRQNELRKQKNKILFWIFLASFCAIMASIFWANSIYFGFILALLGTAGSIYMAFSLKPIDIIKQLSSTCIDYKESPF